ncbi:MAG: DUF4440 domain-containing protein [Pseudomonadota bacterium]
MSEATLSPTDINAIKQMMQDWTANMVTGDWQTWKTFWAEDGVLMPPDHARVVGHAALFDFVSSSFGTIGGFKFTDWTFDGTDTLATVTNTIEIYAGADQSGTPAAVDKQMLLVRKHADGNWRVHKVIFNADGAP